MPPPPENTDIARVCGVLEDLELGENELVSLYRHPVLDMESQNLSKGNDIAIAEQVRNDEKGLSPRPLRERARVRGKKFAQQTETNLFTYLPIHLFTSKKVAFTLAEGATHVAQPKNVGKAAFTLAEVLITLGIIGVVSAMTLPTLVKNHQRKVYVTQLHKAYNQISQAFELVMADSNATKIRESTLTRNGVENFMRNYFKTTKICTGDSVTDCFASEYENLNGDAFTLGIFGTGTSHNTASMITADGASIFISVPNNSVPAGQAVSSLLWVVLDVNGKQGPNILGRDLFDYAIDQNGNISQSQDITNLISNFSKTCGSATDFAGAGDDGVETQACFGRILDDNWQMDY